MQDLNETRVGQLNSIWTLAAQLEQTMISRSGEQVSHVLSEIPRNEPRLDSMMFIRHNAVPNWQEPQDMQFEPSPVWHDDATLITDETAKVFLRNLLSKSKAQSKEFKAEADKKRKEVENAKKVRQNVRDGKDKRDEAEVVRSIFAMQEDLHLTQRKWLTAETEAATVTGAVGDLSLGAVNHNFRHQTFKIPTNCDLCGDRIWGLSAKGFDCTACGYTCHSKCEMKVPAECPGEQSKEDKKKLKIQRQEQASATPAYDESQATSPTNGSTAELPDLSRRNTMNSLSSGYSANTNARSTSALPTVPDSGGEQPPVELSASSSPAPAPASTPAPKPTSGGRRKMAAPPPAQYVSGGPPTSNGGGASKPSEPRGKMLYPYEANGDDEVTVDEGRDVVIVEPDGQFPPLFLAKHGSRTNEAQ